MPHSYPGCSQHAPNEHFPVALAREALGIMAGLYWDLGEPGTPRARHVMARISYVSLGCPKALVDSERILTTLRSEGYEISREHAGADLVIVNTCGFLDSAQAESLDAIGDGAWPRTAR